MNPNNEAQSILRSLEDINFVALAATIVVAWLVVVAIQWAIPWLSKRLPPRFRFYLLPLVPILRLIILTFAAVQVVAGVIQPSTQNLLALAGASAVAIGFAFKDYVSSIIAGIVAIYERPYRPGDWVTMSGYYGEVQSVGLRAIRMVTPDDTVVSIPHGNIWNGPVANANDGGRSHMCVAHFYLQPDHDPATVRAMLYDVALASPYIQLDRNIVVTVREEPWTTHYRLKAYPTDSRNEFLFTSDLTIRAKQALRALGVSPAQIPPTLVPSEQVAGR